MRKLAAILFLIAPILTFLIVGPAQAGTFDDALYAYQRGDYETTYQLIRPLAESGDPTAQYFLGFLHHEGKGVPKNYSKAAKWYRMAAEQGFAQAQANLGIMYLKSTEVPQDYSEAAKWLRKAADQGHPTAQYELGLMYTKGAGVPQDYVRAHMWFNLAASQYPTSETDNRLDAARLRDALALQMTPAQITEAQRLAQEWEPKKEK
jgi:TPR repeat protein